MAGSLKMKRISDSQAVRGSLTGTYTAATDVITSGPTSPYATTNISTRAAVGDTTQGAALAAGVLTITPGFIPKRVLAMNVTDRISWEFFDGMNQGDYLEQVANGTRTLETDDKIVINTTTGVVTITLSDLSVGDNDSLVWSIEA